MNERVIQSFVIFFLSFFQVLLVSSLYFAPFLSLYVLTILSSPFYSFLSLSLHDFLLCSPVNGLCVYPTPDPVPGISVV